MFLTTEYLLPLALGYLREHVQGCLRTASSPRATPATWSINYHGHLDVRWALGCGHDAHAMCAGPPRAPATRTGYTSAAAAFQHHRQRPPTFVFIVCSATSASYGSTFAISCFSPQETSNVRGGTDIPEHQCFSHRRQQRRTSQIFPTGRSVALLTPHLPSVRIITSQLRLPCFLALYFNHRRLE